MMKLATAQSPLSNECSYTCCDVYAYTMCFSVKFILNLIKVLFQTNVLILNNITICPPAIWFYDWIGFVHSESLHIIVASPFYHDARENPKQWLHYCLNRGGICHLRLMRIKQIILIITSCSFISTCKYFGSYLTVTFLMLERDGVELQNICTHVLHSSVI